MTTIDMDIEWMDDNGDPMKVVSVNEETRFLAFKWIGNDSRPTPRIVSIAKFLSVATPKDEQTSPASVKPPSQQPVAKVWIDESTMTIGKSSILVLSNQEWLERGMHAKTVKFDIGQGGTPPEVNWEDRCAAIAGIYTRPAKALASIILWCDDSVWDWSEAFSEVIQHLADHMVKQCNEHGRSEPKGCKHSLRELAELMARMVLYFELYQLWDVYTVKGRLMFSGIDINDRTYSNHFLWYQKQMLVDLEGLVITINDAIGWYRRKLNEED